MERHQRRTRKKPKLRQKRAPKFRDDSRLSQVRDKDEIYERSFDPKRPTRNTHFKFIPTTGRIRLTSFFFFSSFLLFFALPPPSGLYVLLRLFVSFPVLTLPKAEQKVAKR